MGCCVTKKGSSSPSIALEAINLKFPNGSKGGGVVTSESRRLNQFGSRANEQSPFDLDLQQGKNKSLNGNEKVYVAIYDYDARTDEDLTFRVGDLLYIVDDRSVPSACPSLTIRSFFLVKAIGGWPNIVKLD